MGVAIHFVDSEDLFGLRTYLRVVYDAVLMLASLYLFTNLVLDLILCAYSIGFVHNL